MPMRKVRELEWSIEKLSEENGKPTQRQVAGLTENAPPITGPRIQPTPQHRPLSAVYSGASLRVVNEV